MKHTVFILTVILSTLFLAGCDNSDSINSPVSSLDKSGEESISLQKVTEQANGSGHFRLEDGSLRSFTFSARRSAEGEVSGHFNLNRTQGGVHYSGSIVCFTKEGNQAWFLGIIEQSNVTNEPSIAPGAYNVFWVEDNGQGKNADPDRITGSFSFSDQGDIDFFLSLCDVPYLSPADFDADDEWIAIESGNVNIK